MEKQPICTSEIQAVAQKEQSADRELTFAETRDHARRLLKVYKDALKAAPEFAQSLQQAHFKTDHFKALSEGEGIEFNRGGYTWNLSYQQFEDEAGESMSLARYGRHVSGDIEDVSLSIKTQGISSARRVIEAGVKHTLAGDAYEQSTADTTQAVQGAERLLTAFRNAGTPKPQA